MDEATLREAAETHAKATVERDYATAGSYLSGEMMARAGEVMKEMPRPLTDAEVVSVEGAVALIRYSGESGSATVESRWEEVDGEPRIVGLEVTEKS